MAQLLNLHITSSHSQIQSLLRSPLFSSRYSFIGNPNPRWTVLRDQLKCDGRCYCLFADGRKQEQARKALESALGEKKDNFEKWSKEIQKREERGGGGASGGGASGGGGGGWFGWFGGDHFWEEAQQAIIAIVGIISLFLLLAKGSVMFAIVSNSLLFVLRGTRNGFAFVSTNLSKVTSLSSSGSEAGPESDVAATYPPKMSAKERVVRKWGMD